MNDKRSKSPKYNLPLDARFASRPHVHARLHEIADMMDEAIAEGATADEAEALAIEQLRQLGSDVLTDWAQQKQEDSLNQVQKENPSAIRHVKKK
jgi:hypothetical protein